jgi:hypothetical protein
MSRTSALMLLGVLVMLAPFSGLPSTFRTLLLVIFGITILGIGLTLRTQEVRQAQSSSSNQTPEPESPATHIPTNVSPL